MKTYTLFWRTGITEIVKGNTPEEAMTLAGYSNGAVKALDLYGNGDIRNEYAWNATARSWEQIESK